MGQSHTFIFLFGVPPSIIFMLLLIRRPVYNQYETLADMYTTCRR